MKNRIQTRHNKDNEIILFKYNYNALYAYYIFDTLYIVFNKVKKKTLFVEEILP